MVPAQSPRCLFSRLFAARPRPHALSPPWYIGLAREIKDPYSFLHKINFSQDSEIFFGKTDYRTRSDRHSRSLHVLYRIPLFLFTPFLPIHCFPGIYFFSTPKAKSTFSETGFFRCAVGFATTFETLKPAFLL